MIDAVPGTNGSGPAVTNVSGAAVTAFTASEPINIDGDTDVEWLAKALVTVDNSGITQVNVDVTFPTCSGPPISPDNSNPDYIVSVDLCHGNDVGLGLFGGTVGSADCGAADGEQDRLS